MKRKSKNKKKHTRLNRIQLKSVEESLFRTSGNQVPQQGLPIKTSSMGHNDRKCS